MHPGAGSPPPQLAGRRETLDDGRIAFQRIKSRRPSQSPILVGLRGVGKTVLMVELLKIAEKEDFHVIYLEAHEGKTLPELIAPEVRRVLFALSKMENAKEKANKAIRVFKSFLSGIHIKYGDFDVGVSAELGAADSGDLEADLPVLISAIGEAANSARKTIAIFIDELQYLSKIEFSALIMAMHRCNQRQFPVIFIGAGLPQVLSLAGNSKSYAERLFTYPEIGALSEADARLAIIEPAKKQGVVIEEAAVNQILMLTERYPYYLQQWAYEAWNVATGNTIKASDINTAHNQALSEFDSGFFKVRFERCTPSEKRYMRALAHLGEGTHRSGDVAEILGLQSKSVAPTRGSLIKKGMIYSPAHGDTKFTVPLYSDYMKRVMQLK